jgi:hypothetical protein
LGGRRELITTAISCGNTSLQYRRPLSLVIGKNVNISKGSIVTKYFLVILAVFFVFGCERRDAQVRDAQVNVGENGVTVDAPGVHVETGPGGAKVNAPGVRVDAGEGGTSVVAPGTNVEAGPGGTQVTAPGTNVDVER